MDAPAGKSTYLLVDGENIDATLGVSVLGRRPNPDERPRWERVRDFAQEVWQQPVKGLFFLNASSGHLPMSFVQALIALEYRPIPLAGSASEKVVDIGIQRTLDAIGSRDGDVLLASHDGDFLPQVTKLLGDGRRVGMLGFREFFNSGSQPSAPAAWRCSTSRTRSEPSRACCRASGSSPIEEFDPVRFL